MVSISIFYLFYLIFRIEQLCDMKDAGQYNAVMLD